MNTEYDSLRAEIKAWQDRRFTVLASTAGLVTTILSLRVFGDAKASENWTWASAFMLVLLSISCSLTWYAGRASAKIAAYLVVFHEATPNPVASWDSRLEALGRSGGDFWTLNRLMLPIYVLLGFLALVAPMFSHLKYNMQTTDWIIIVAAGVMFVSSIIALSRSAPKQYYIALWRAIAEKARENPDAA